MAATDIGVPEILTRIRANVSRNKELIKGQIVVLPLDLKTEKLGVFNAKLSDSRDQNDKSNPENVVNKTGVYKVLYTLWEVYLLLVCWGGISSWEEGKEISWLWGRL